MFRATKDANDRKLARRKFRQAMREDILSKAPGMKFVVNLAGKKQKMTPRVIHALGTKYCFECLFNGNYYDCMIVLVNTVRPFERQYQYKNFTIWQINLSLPKKPSNGSEIRIHSFKLPILSLYVWDHISKGNA